MAEGLAGKRGNDGEQAKGARDAKGSAEPDLDLQASCAPFTHTQTYAAWGPAVCVRRPGDRGLRGIPVLDPRRLGARHRCRGNRQVSSRAPTAEGTLLEHEAVHRHRARGESRRNAEAWPPTWWDCSVPYASYTWQIPGVYTLPGLGPVTASGASTSSSQGVGAQDVSWTHDGCA